MAYSLSGEKFQFIQEEGDSGDKVFMGNLDNGLKASVSDFP